MKKVVKEENTTCHTFYNTANTDARQMLNGTVITGNKNILYRIITRMHKTKTIGKAPNFCQLLFGTNINA